MYKLKTTCYNSIRWIDKEYHKTKLNINFKNRRTNMELNKIEQMKKLIAALRYTMNAIDSAIADSLLEGDIKDNANTLSLDIEEILKSLESNKAVSSKKEKAEKPVKAKKEKKVKAEKKTKKVKKEKATKVKKAKKAKSEKKVAKVKKTKKVAKVKKAAKVKAKKTKKSKKSK